MNPQNSQAPQNQPAQNVSNNTLMAVLAYLGILIIVPLLTDARNDPFVKFHIKQGVVLIISFVAQFVVGIIPLLGWIVAFILFVLNIVCVIIGIVNAATGKQKELPVIGKFASKFNFRFILKVAHTCVARQGEV